MPIGQLSSHLGSSLLTEWARFVWILGRRFDKRIPMSGRLANIVIVAGELFDLEALSRTCKELNRYSFFVTSMPLNSMSSLVLFLHKIRGRDRSSS